MFNSGVNISSFTTIVRNMTVFILIGTISFLFTFKVTYNFKCLLNVLYVQCKHAQGNDLSHRK